jgi:glycosyltransferase involved in cell wall biosynthesis
VVIAARDAEATIGAALDGLAAQTFQGPFEVIVVDNGSLDATAELAERHAVRPRVIRRLRGGGPGVARNDGVAATAAPVIAFTDSDCAPAASWLEAGVTAMRGADIVQGRVSPPPGERPGPFDHVLWVVSERGLYETANLFVRREGFIRAGGFRDWINADRRGGAKPARPFGEDVHLAWRMRRLGARTAFSDRAEVHHAVLASTAKAYLVERDRDGLFAGLVRQVPELRRALLWGGWFLGRRAAAADLAAAGLVASFVRRSPLPLLVVAPWLRLVRTEARARGDGSLRVTAIIGVGDAIGLVSRVRGSLRWRTPVL